MENKNKRTREILETPVSVKLDGPNGPLPDSLALMLYAASQIKDPGRYYRVAAVDKKGNDVCSLFVWPADGLCDVTGDFHRACTDKTLSFSVKSRIRVAENFFRHQPLGWCLWRVGQTHGDEELLPWLNAGFDTLLALQSWPELPPESLVPDVAKALARMAKTSLSIRQMSTVLGLPRPKLISVANAVAMQGRLLAGVRPENPFAKIDFEQALFVGALSTKIDELFAAAVES